MSWVDIKKNNQKMRVPYQAFKDVFEHDGFTLVDESSCVDPTFSVSNEPQLENKEPITPPTIDEVGSQNNLGGNESERKQHNTTNNTRKNNRKR